MRRLKALVFSCCPLSNLEWLPDDVVSRAELGVHWIGTLDRRRTLVDNVMLVDPDRVDEIITLVGVIPVPTGTASRMLASCREVLAARRLNPLLPVDYELYEE